MRVHVNIKVSGRVQRIGFRYSTMETARSLGICGFVQNLDDGSVYIEAEAAEDVIMAFIQWCRQGPTWAHVEQVNVEKAALRNFASFEIIS